MPTLHSLQSIASGRHWQLRLASARVLSIWLACTLSLLLSPLAGCHTSRFPNHERTSPRSPESAPLDALVDTMVGSFSSAEQAQANPAFRHVILHMAPIVHLAEVDPHTRWLYIEQAMAETPDRPYRQRAYRVRMVNGDRNQFESAVFEFAGDPLRLAGAWNSPSRLTTIRIDDLRIREGCEVLLHARHGAPDGLLWQGSTLGDHCTSTLLGAAYAESEVKIYADRIKTWDRGYDASGNQVWGSVAGPYEFQRLR